MVDADQIRDHLGSGADYVRFEAWFADAPLAVAIADADGRCAAVNHAFCALFGAPDPDIDLFRGGPVGARDLSPQLRRAFAGEPVVVPAIWIDGSSRRPLAIELSLTPVTDHDGVVRHVALTYTDVTPALERDRERERARLLEEQNARIHEANRLKSEFLAAMSHELRTPLNTIIGFAELVFYGRVAPDSAEHHEFIGDILTSSRHLLQLINDVLDLAKIEAGKLEFRPEPVVVESVIAEVASLLRTLSLQKRIRVQIEADRSIEVVVLDPARLKQVLYNYLSNALKFTPEGGHVVVRTCPDRPGSFRVEVEDSGIGIAPEHLQRLFLEFEQLETGAAIPQSTGLGLALTRRIVEAQGGTVGVRSHLGHGSVFHAVLPRETFAIPAR
ncbi:MAG TPA: ATP-binding protein [Kofleriaceae bacterium]|nr:ATP-binding protein [Kofleriaceae bacterium]